ncbi:poly-gamma-glutamate synthase PgsB [Streptomyces sp. DG2A-72]|uniref:poly-gamma-glutamate synthase PgsB n=1 Tax=Streptomyces sp. DG2A-72 TaxID=3051386 RepID=UPI00265BD7B0|nr:poly-gamma-glutamate synthase PgsB [Streptomyces sp. DG2A-72]MDO0935634.1 poly-gamma-glutamate synthase PgsB [Streptomyces sp. DG2A-72]
MLYLYFVLLIGGVFLLIAGIIEQRRHYAALHTIPSRVLVNGIRGKSSITRLCAGALRGGDLVTVAKTTGTAARFIHPDATEEPVYRKFGIANVVEQIGIVRRAATYRPDALVIECMAVMPALQEVNQSKLIRSTIGVLCNVREDHLAEMGPTLDDVARSLCRSMPEDGICVTAEKERFHILQEEADARNCKLIYADPETVTDEELRGFSWFTFKENVAIALVVADLLGIERKVALQGMYDAPPDPGVLSVEKYVAPDGKRLAFANVFAANDPESTLMNINQLLDLGAIRRPLNVVINCRPDRVERNGQMGEIIPDLRPDNVFVIGHPSKSAIDAIPADWRDRAVDLGGERRAADEFMPTLLGRMSDGSSLVAIGNIHGQGEELLEYLAELPADESDADEAGQSAAAAPHQPQRLDPYASYPTAYEERYQASQTQEIPVISIPAQAPGRYAEAPGAYAGAVPGGDHGMGQPYGESRQYPGAQQRYAEAQQYGQAGPQAPAQLPPGAGQAELSAWFRTARQSSPEPDQGQAPGPGARGSQPSYGAGPVPQPYADDPFGRPLRQPTDDDGGGHPPRA